MERTSKMGMNRTGVQMSPIDFQKLLKDTELTPRPIAMGDPITDCRMEHIREADRLGSVPPPGTLKGVLKSGLQMLGGKRPQVLIDKLGERLAFERGGTRLYDALLAKAEMSSGILPEGAIDILVEFRDAEQRHAHLVWDSLERMGADPTAVTPCADTIGVSSMGLIQSVSDPRTTVAQSLNAVLTAELTDHAGWELLIALAQSAGQEELASQFTAALEEEARHLQTIRQWLEAAVLEEAEASGREGRRAH